MSGIARTPTKALLKQVQALKKRIAKDRDELRELISDIEEIGEGCDEAVDALQRAADSLSTLI